MKAILEKNETAAKLCGKQRIKSDVDCRLISFCITLPCEDGTLLYHTLTCELLLLEKGETIQNCADTLKANWFLVPISFDERKWARDIRRIATLFVKKTEALTEFTVFTTTDCNARCCYCYELGYDRVSMTAQTAHDAAGYIEKVSKGQEVKLHWFGGEPLFNQEAIEIITSDLRKRNVTFHSIITSNGYYLDAETSKKAVEQWNLKSVQISLDGTKNVYNRTKAYINESGDAYERIMSNIYSALDCGISVTVRLNVDKHNTEDMLMLCDDLSRRFAGRKGFAVYAEQVRAFHKPVKQEAAQAEPTDNYIALVKKIDDLNLGINRKLPGGIRVNCCMADNDSAIAILPDGRLGKCEHIDNNEIIGGIYDTHRDQALLHAWKEQVWFSECEDCPLYPQCVNLKMCDWSKLGCTGPRRAMRMYQLEQKILAAYWEHKANYAELTG